MAFGGIFSVEILNAEKITHRVRGVRLSIQRAETLGAPEALWMVVALRSLNNSKS